MARDPLILVTAHATLGITSFSSRLGSFPTLILGFLKPFPEDNSAGSSILVRQPLLTAWEP